MDFCLFFLRIAINRYSRNFLFINRPPTLYVDVTQSVCILGSKEICSSDQTERRQ